MNVFQILTASVILITALTGLNLFLRLKRK